MFRADCRAIFSLMFRQVECIVYSAFSLRDLVLEEFVKNNDDILYKNCEIKIISMALYKRDFKTI